MPVSVKEDWESDPLSYGSDGGNAGYHFNIKGAGSDLEAWQALVDYSPALNLGLVRSKVTVKQNGPKFHKGTVLYSTTGPAGGDTADAAVGATPPEEHAAPASPEEPLTAGYDFTFAAEMKHRTQSISTLDKRAIGDPLLAVGTAPDYGRAVGVERSGGNVKVAGYDAPEPTHVWSRTVDVNPMTLAYKKQIRSLIGKKNNATFYDSAAGEVVLWGASARQVDGQRYTLTFTFHERPNIENLIIRPGTDPDDPADPDALVISAAKGWDHIWVIYEEEVEDDELLKRPIYAYVEQIIYNGDFSLLRIGA